MGYRLMLGLLLAGLLALGGTARAQEFTWPRSDAASEGIDPDMLLQLEAAVRSGSYGRIKSLLVLRHGKLVYENYFNGYRADDLLPLYSVTKSWAAALVGIALRRGDLESIDQPVADILTQYSSIFNARPDKRSIRVRDLLTMRHGLAWDEWSSSFTSPANPVYQMTQSTDWWQFVLNRNMTASRDSVFRYSTGASNLLGALIRAQTGLSALDYAREHLFATLDIDEYHVEVDLSDGPRGSGISQFQAGLTPTGHGLWLKATDLAKLGQLYLDGGVWRNQRLFDRDWQQQSWQAFSSAASDPSVFSGSTTYGLQWWGFRIDSPYGPLQVHMAEGYADQFLLLVPQLDLLVVSNADNGQYGGPDMRHALRDVIVPAVSSDFDPVNDGGLTGTWVSPQRQHQGFMLEVVPGTGQLVIYWMTFEPETRRQQWMLAQGILHGRRALLEFRMAVEGVFDGDQPAIMEYWGDAEVQFQSCTEASMSFASPVANVQGELQLRRLTPNVYCQDEADQ